MAKDKTEKTTNTQPTSTTITPTVSRDAPAPSAASPGDTARRAGSALATTAPAAARSDDTGTGVVAQVADVATASVRATRRLLPGRVPAVLGAGALLVAGVIDFPALLAGGLAYEALRRWEPAAR